MNEYNTVYVQVFGLGVHSGILPGTCHPLYATNTTLNSSGYFWFSLVLWEKLIFENVHGNSSNNETYNIAGIFSLNLVKI